MEKKSALFLTQAAMIAALYVVLTYIANLFGLASGVIQIRLSEMLCILPVFTPAAIPGLFIGCLLSNILTGCVIWDILFGSLATLAGAIGTYLLRNHKFVFYPSASGGKYDRGASGASVRLRRAGRCLVSGGYRGSGGGYLRLHSGNAVIQSSVSAAQSNLQVRYPDITAGV